MARRQVGGTRGLGPDCGKNMRTLMVFEVSAIIVGVLMSVRRLADDDDDDQRGMSFEVTTVQA